MTVAPFYQMSRKDILQLFREVRADYVATLRDCHGLRRSVKDFDPNRFSLVRRLDEAIVALEEEQKAVQRL